MILKGEHCSEITTSHVSLDVIILRSATCTTKHANQTSITSVIAVRLARDITRLPLAKFLIHSTIYTTRSPLSSPNKLKYDISLSRCIGWFYAVFFSGLILVFLLTGQLSLFPFLFQRHDAKNGKRDEGWKRMKSCQSRWFQYDCFSCRVFTTSSQ